ncbi:uncharacterized protein DUF3883 [Georgenia soli]|uniref:Uncharacterized protein DUF3883 n=1 Tax=Georgenia soli TaxID=638953 RepID=A0A2A9EQP4_9MICO|nr:DUF3883 domain-containing protein [Georgenia soli]PFG40602.1 uncharacterized protein DUF3883 [Georgenia soli]
MAINEWWAGDPEQRYWMEITDRSDLGADLFAPTADGSGRPYWGYELLTYVQPGDVVLHWHKSLAGEPGIVGWSQATGSYEDTDIEWQARGTVGRASGSLAPRPAWRMPLLNFMLLPDPVLITDVRSHDAELRQILAELETEHDGGSLYFPFGFSDKRELRAQQTYFVKMPREVLEVLGLDELERVPRPAPSPSRQGGKADKRGDSGYIADSAVRSAIEWHAVNLAVEAYISLGYEVEYTGASKPYDLLVTQGSDVRRVEVKGTSGAAKTVELTIGEVDNSRETTPTDLYVVDGIQWWREADGTVQTDGGDTRWWTDWVAADSSLKATRFRYFLPSGG